MRGPSSWEAIRVDQRFQALKEYLRSSIWYVPSFMGVAALLLGVVATALDRRLPTDHPLLERLLYGGTVEGARSILSSLAASLVTLAGLVFSMTVVALSFASSHQGPRILRNFPSDRGNQVVMGWFVGSFLYCIFVLSSLQGGEDTLFVPRFAITLGLVLATTSLAFLVYFVQRVARMLQTDDVVRDIRERLQTRIEKTFEEPVGERSPRSPPREAEYPHALFATSSGYIQGIDYETLGKAAQADGVRVLCTRRAGHFVVEANELARTSAPVDDPARYERTFVTGPMRTEAQDVEFSLRQSCDSGRPSWWRWSTLGSQRGPQ